MTKKQRILAISKALKLSHIGSCLSILPILQEIYAKREGDIIILDGAHAHLAHLMFTHPDHAEKLIQKDIHCNKEAGCDINGGSLGHGIGIGIGMALINDKQIVNVIVTDGSMQEGSNWEALRLKRDLKLTNLRIWGNLNGFTAVSQIDHQDLAKRITDLCPDATIYFTNNGEGFSGVQGHYRTL